MEYVWVKPGEVGEFELPFGARILERRSEKVRILDDDGREGFVHPSDILGPVHPSCLKHVDDLITLGDLQEYSILRNLHMRYREKIIYTYTGNLLIAINPYENIPNYGPEVIRQYSKRRMEDLPPHVYAVGAVTYREAMLDKERHCIIINGESGAGKTRTATLLVDYYAFMSTKPSKAREKILESYHILEAFGNAKTVRNDNSSRFGMYLTINFNADGTIEGAEIKDFLLEKSRIVSHCKGETNYHVFYSMMDGLPEKQKNLLGLKQASFYKYISEGETESECTVEGFNKLLRAMKIFGFSDDEIWQIFELLAAILHFGSISYESTPVFGMPGVDVVDTRELNFISALFGVSSQSLKSCLTTRTISTVRERITKNLSAREATDSRDAFVKALYGNLFRYVIDRMNESLRGGSESRGRCIGILDVFGFENLETNSFEQLCINWANEFLQQFFILHAFKLEQYQYAEEGIEWRNITYVDNEGIIELISGKPGNIISIINDESKLSHSTDDVLLGKLIKWNEENESFWSPKFKKISIFGIQHFADTVLYDVRGFLDKNRDSYGLDFKTMVRESENGLLKKIFSHDFERESPRSSMKGLADGKFAKRFHTLATKFKSSLDSLLAELNRCRPFFVKCIKPNNLKRANLFDRSLCCQQLRYSGILETSEIRKMGYAVRFAFAEFVHRYRVLVYEFSPREPIPSGLDARELTRWMCSCIFEAPMDHRLGHTKVFLKKREYIWLEAEREKAAGRFAVTLQAAIRGWMCRKRFARLSAAAVVIQKHWRGSRRRREYEVRRRGLMRLQAAINARVWRILYVFLRRVTTRLQARCRGFIARREYQRRIEERKAKTREVDRKVSANIGETCYVGSNPRKKVVRQESYLHRRRERPHVKDKKKLEEMSKLVDDTFNFLGGD